MIPKEITFDRNGLDDIFFSDITRFLAGYQTNLDKWACCVGIADCIKKMLLFTCHTRIIKVYLCMHTINITVERPNEMKKIFETSFLIRTYKISI